MQIPPLLYWEWFHQPILKERRTVSVGSSSLSHTDQDPSWLDYARVAVDDVLRFQVSEGPDWGRFVFIPKYRRKAFFKEVRTDVGEILRTLCQPGKQCVGH